MSGINPDYSKRDCSLPPGCKDLIDVLRLESGKQAETNLVAFKGSISVRDLAALLGQKPMQIIADLLGMKVLAGVTQTVSLEVAAKVAAKYGFTSK
jgi:hypothetical protein